MTSSLHRLFWVESSSIEAWIYILEACCCGTAEVLVLLSRAFGVISGLHCQRLAPFLSLFLHRDFARCPAHQIFRTSDLKSIRKSSICDLPVCNLYISLSFERKMARTAFNFARLRVFNVGSTAFHSALIYPALHRLGHYARARGGGADRFSSKRLGRDWCREEAHAHGDHTLPPQQVGSARAD